MMAEVIVDSKPKHLCDWCGREADQPLVTVTLVSQYGAFRDDVCEPCRHAFETEDQKTQSASQSG